MGIPLIGSIPTERGFHLPDVFSQPELLTPGMKPVGNVKIDWNHPLATGLTVCILFQSPEPRDLVTGAALTKGGGPYFTPDGQYFDEVDDYYTLANVTIFRKHSIITQPTFTDNTGSAFQYFLNWGNVTTTDTVNWYLGESSSAANPNQFLYTPGAMNAKFNYWATYNGVPAAIVFDSDRVTRTRLWLGGIEQTLAADDGTAWLGSSATRTLYIGGRNDLNVDRFFGGTLKYLYIYGARVLSPVEIVSLQRDPYQFLIPVA